MKNHSITPPPELVQQWLKERYNALPAYAVNPSETAFHIATQAARWGADQLRAARRPKPPSLKEQALTVLDGVSGRLDAAHENTLRRALEAMPDD